MLTMHKTLVTDWLLYVQNKKNVSVCVCVCVWPGPLA